MKKPKIILISGKAQSGKDEFSNFFIEKAGKSNTCIRLAYGDFVKFVCEKYFGWNGIKDEEGRKILQFIGTDMARKVHPDIWVNMTIDLVKGIGRLYDYVLISDTRFANEITKWSKENYETIVVRVNRPNFDSGLTKEQKEHKSETELDTYDFFDYILNNIGTLNDYKKTVEDLTDVINGLYNLTTDVIG
jgi:hypothetical protein